MNDTEWRLTVRELEKGGFADAVTPRLRTMLDKGQERIEAPLLRWFGADEVQGKLQLRKSDRSDSYSLESFDMLLRKAGHTDWLQQNFQQFGGPYTLPEAYNLLSGRPVYKRIGYGGGKPTEAWLKLDLERRLENGNYASKYYHPKDGFDLGAVLGRYPIRELEDDRQRKALIGSLQRGDLAAVTVDGADGLARKLFVTPSIPTRSLLVQDENGIRVSPEKLAQGAVSRLAPVAERTVVRRDIRQIGERQPVARRQKRQRLS
jgi:hypothetical protein